MTNPNLIAARYWKSAGKITSNSEPDAIYAQLGKAERTINQLALQHSPGTYYDRTAVGFAWALQHLAAADRGRGWLDAAADACAKACGVERSWALINGIKIGASLAAQNPKITSFDMGYSLKEGK